MQDNNNYLLQRIPISNMRAPTAVALVMHGLNLKPSKMFSIIEQLTNSDIEVFNCSLSGHGDNYSHQSGLSSVDARLESFKRVSYEVWRNETHIGYRQTYLRSMELGNVPIFFVGFSLGGLMGCDLFATLPDARFDRLVLFAPALKIRKYSYTLRLLSPFPYFIFPSAAPEDYRCNRGTSIAAYSALYTAIANLAKHMTNKLNVPTLVFVDQQDELVSYKGIKRMVEQENLTQWSLCSIQKESSAGKQYHHLIIDDSAVGYTVWKKMTGMMMKHLCSRSLAPNTETPSLSTIS